MIESENGKAVKLWIMLSSLLASAILLQTPLLFSKNVPPLNANPSPLRTPLPLSTAFSKEVTPLTANPSRLQTQLPLSEACPKGFDSIAIQGGQFVLNGQPIQLLAGEMHPSRIPRADWKSRIEMAKAMGLNSIACYIFWDCLEPEPGRFNFKGRNDIPAFLKLCKEENMPVLLRPGPYCCAEWEFGGFPYWLLNIPGLILRANNSQYLAQTGKYFRELGRVLGPLQITHGGPIITVQVENEYGSFGKSKAYMKAIKDQIQSAGFDVPLVICDGGSELANDWIPGTVVGVNGAGGPDMEAAVNKYTPGGPYICTEFYPGWLDHWGEPFVRTGGGLSSYKNLISHGISVSMYMFHGGTNFGYMDGANYSDHYEPQITSYDYDAPLDESGRPTKKFFEYRKIIEDTFHRKLPPVPVIPAPITIPQFQLKFAGTLENNLPAQIATYVVPPNFESIGQAYGFVLYRTFVPSQMNGSLIANKVRDFAVVLVNGKVIGSIDRMKHQDSLPISIPNGGAYLDLLVENEGRINYGGKIRDNHKGILGDVSIAGYTSKLWSVFRLNMGHLPLKSPTGSLKKGPSFYTGTFDVSRPGDTFLDMRGWNKGFVWVNGHNLGRYWKIGPQQALYLPGCWLHRGKNEIKIFDEFGMKNPQIAGLNHSILDQLNLPMSNRPTK